MLAGNDNAANANASNASLAKLPCGHASPVNAVRVNTINAINTSQC